MRVNGSFNHEAARAMGGSYSDSSHLLPGKFSSGEHAWGQREGIGVRGDGGTTPGLVLASCPKLCPGHPVFLTCLITTSPAKEKKRLQRQCRGFRTFECWLGLFSPFIEEIRKQPKSLPRSGGVQWAELYEWAGGSMGPFWHPKLSRSFFAVTHLDPHAVSFPFPSVTPLKAELLPLVFFKCFQVTLSSTSLKPFQASTLSSPTLKIAVGCSGAVGWPGASLTGAQPHPPTPKSWNPS